MSATCLVLAHNHLSPLLYYTNSISIISTSACPTSLRLACLSLLHDAVEKCHPSTCDFTLPVWVAYIIPPALRYVAPALLLLVCSAMLDPGVLVNLGPVQDAIGSTAAWMILNPVVDTMNPISGGPPAAVETSAAGRGAMSVALWVALCKVAARRVVGMNAYVSVQR